MASLAQCFKRKVRLQSAVNDANEDLFPTPPEQRTWMWWVYSALWAGQSFDATWVRVLVVIALLTTYLS